MPVPKGASCCRWGRVEPQGKASIRIRRAPMRYENSVTINRPVEDVFSYMANVENSPTWQNPVLEARQTSSGPMGVGATYVVRAKLLGRQFQSTAEVTAWNPPHSWTVKTTSGPVHGTGQF